MARKSLTASVFTRSGGGVARDPAEVVFESSSVAHAAAVERRTLREIEDKAVELRTLVGASYRDLIASADTILEMRATADGVVASLRRMHGELSALSALRDTELSAAAGGASAAAAAGADAAGRAARDALFATGCRVAFVAECPELLWSCLEDGELAAAADRLAAARDVHASLGGADVAARFPLLRGLWPAVDAFRASVGQAAKARAADAAAPARAVADALAAAALVEEAHALGALGAFLDARGAALRAGLEQAAGQADTLAASPAQAAAAAAAGLAQAVATAQAALCQAGELFLDAPGVTPLLAAALAELPPLAALAASLPGPEAELATWSARRAAAAERLRPLPPAAVGAAARAWLSQAAEDVAKAAPRLLGHITRLRGAADASAAPSGPLGLVELEVALRRAIAAAPAAAAAARWAGAADAQCGAALAAASPADAPAAAWGGACRAVLGEPLCLWSAFFADAFLSRTAALAAAALAALPLAPAAAEALQQLTTPPPPAPGALAPPPAVAAQWSLDDVEDGSSASVPPSSGEPLPPDLERYAAPRLGPEAALVRATDAALRSLRRDLVAALDGAKKEGAEHGAHLEAAAPSPRVAAAEAAAAAAAADALDAAVASLRGHLASASAAAESSSSDAAAAALAVERALFVGRLAAQLAERSAELPLWLGPPAAWRAEGAGEAAARAPGGARAAAAERARARRASAAAGAAAAAATSAAGAGAAAAPPSRAASLAEALRSLSLDAHAVWTRRAAAQLAAAFREAMSHDDALASPAVPRAWEETLLSDGTSAPSASEADGAAMRVPLPAQPSAYVAAMLYGAAREVGAVGAPGAPPPAAAVRELCARCADAALCAYEAAAASGRAGGGALSERGVLQMLFDVRYAADVLAAGSPEAAAAASAPPTLGGASSIRSSSSIGGAPDARSSAAAAAAAAAAASAAAAAAAPFKARVSPLLASLSSRLDPIDWATYEPFVWANARRCYARTGVLLGALVALRPLHAGASGRLAPGGDAAAAAAAAHPPLPRFAYLPVAPPAPLFAASGAEALRAAVAGGAAGGAAAALQRAEAADAAAAAAALDAEAPPALLKAFAGGAARGLGALLGEAGAGRLKAGFGDLMGTNAGGGGLLNLMGTNAL